MEIWKQSACTKNMYTVFYSQLKMKEATGHKVTMFEDLQELMTSSGSLSQLLRASPAHLDIRCALPHKAPCSVEDHTPLAIYSD